MGTKIVTGVFRTREELENFVVEQRSYGRTMQDIAKSCGVSLATVHRISKANIDRIQRKNETINLYPVMLFVLLVIILVVFNGK